VKDHDPYLVVGTGRSGTSTVAGILHNKMDIFMGHEFTPANVTNPEGFWEDVEFNKTNVGFVEGLINYPTWRKSIGKIITDRVALDKPWGFKDPRMATLLGFYLGFLRSPKIIRCIRDKELVISSLMRCYGFDREKATAFWYVRETVLDNTLSGKDFLLIDFGDKRISDAEIIDSVEKKWTKKI